MKPGQNKQQLATVTALSLHLDVSREQIVRLEKQGVIERLPSGDFDLDESRWRYLRHLRQRSPPGEHRKAFEQARAQRERLKLLKETSEVVYTRELGEASDQLVYVVLNRLSPLPAQIGGQDLKLRRLVEDKLGIARDGMSRDMLKLADDLDKGTGKARGTRDIASDTEAP